MSVEYPLTGKLLALAISLLGAAIAIFAAVLAVAVPSALAIGIAVRAFRWTVE